MYCHDLYHTGRSPYITADNPGFEKWWFKAEGFVQGSGVIDNDGIVYFGSWDDNFYAVYPDGSLKWSYDVKGNVRSSPAIDKDGTIYVGIESTSTKYFYAFNPDGTLKWKNDLPGSVYSSPAISDDGTIYFGLECGYPWYGYIYALYPNGTLRWRYETDHVVYSSPAIDDDGTVYCGSHDGNLYALYPDNGSLKWKFPTGDYIRVSPCIGDDGTIYVVSNDNYLYAVNPDGSEKWKTNVGAGTSPTIGQDGTIYAGSGTLNAVDPADGSVKWTYNVPGNIRGGTPCNSADGTIYFGTHDTGFFVALNADGTEKWRRYIGPCEFAPIIDDNGAIYIGSSNEQKVVDGYYRPVGYLHVFNDLDPNAPSTPDIDGPIKGTIDTTYYYTLNSISPIGNDIYYWVDWGDKSLTEWTGPYASGEEVTLGHHWADQENYTIRAKAKDTDDLWGPWDELTVSIPRNKAYSYVFLHRFLEKFPLLVRFLNYFIK